MKSLSTHLEILSFSPFDLKARLSTSVNILLTPPSGGVPTGLCIFHIAHLASSISMHVTVFEIRLITL